MIVRRRENREKAIIPALKRRISDGNSLETIIDKGTIIIITPRKRMIRLITDRIIRKGQKFLADAFQNDNAENLPALLRRDSNNPPVKNAFMIKAASMRIDNPLRRNAIRFLNAVPGSVKASMSNPALSLSVIMLDPKPDLITPFTGSAIRHTRMSDIIDMISAPFHNEREREAPDLKAGNIFISN